MKQKIFTYIFSFVCGILTCAALIMLFAFIEYALGLKQDIAGGMAFLAFTAGCLVSGLICGLIKRRAGLKIGAVCAVVMLVFSIALSFLTGSFSGSAVIAKSAAALFAACTGAVLGVNR